jgi:predicted oxidoreductase
MVPRAKLSPRGPELSRLVYGTWRLLDDPATATPEHLLRRLEICLERGITTVDTAEIYGVYEVEELVGRALALSPGLRQRLEIVTKCGIYVPCARHPDRRVAFYNASAKRIIASAEKSLRLLKTDYLDVLLVHRPDWLTAADDTAEGLETLRRQGKVRHVGVSNYNVHQVELLNSRLAEPVCTNQVELSLFTMNAIEDGTLDQCQRLGILPMAWSPLGGGRLFDPQDTAAQRIRAAMATIASSYDDAKPERLALAWVLAHPSRPLAVFGTNRAERIDSIAAAANLTLDREDWYLLWEAARGHEIP